MAAAPSPLKTPIATGTTYCVSGSSPGQLQMRLKLKILGTSVSSSLRHPSEPKLRAVERDALPPSADLRREHHAIVLKVEQHPR